MNPSTSLKKFLTEEEIALRKTITQQLWEKVRNADDPLIKPEEEYNPKSLYERLQESKERSDMEYDEQKKYKNQVRGLQKEESDFLCRVSDMREQIDLKIQIEEEEELASFREAVNEYATTLKSLQPPVPKTGLVNFQVTTLSPKPTSQQKRAIISGIVKKKMKTEDKAKQQKTSEGVVSHETNGSDVGEEQKDNGSVPCPRIAAYPSAILSLSSLQQYSEDEEEDRDDSSILNANGITNLTHPKFPTLPAIEDSNSSTSDCSSSSSNDEMLSTTNILPK